MENRENSKNTVQNSLSVQAVSKQDTVAGRFTPTHLEHWKHRVFTPTYTRNGQAHGVGTYYSKIQYAGRRETFRLHTSNLDEAARKARDIYLSVVRNGWEAALAVFKPKPVKPVAKLTVGEYLRHVEQTGLITSVTLCSYRTKLRTIVAHICGIGSGRAKGIRYLEWRAKVDTQPLKIITLDAFKRFKREYLARNAADPVKLRHAQVSFDGYVRNMRSLFKQEVLKELADVGVDVPSMPFHEVGMVVKGRSGFAYVSNVQPEALLNAAIADLAKAHPELFKIFVLALLLGLRRGEIDQLRWDMINWERKHIALAPHEFLHLKTHTSIAAVPVEPELLELLRKYKESATGQYVVESTSTPRKAKLYKHYRCESQFEALCVWLRSNGVKADKPLHTLRKECGSLVNEKYGLVAAKNMLRHSSIEITVTYYLADRRRVSTGLESNLGSVGKPAG